VVLDASGSIARAGVLKGLGDIDSATARWGGSLTRPNSWHRVDFRLQCPLATGHMRPGAPPCSIPTARRLKDLGQWTGGGCGGGLNLREGFPSRLLAGDPSGRRTRVFSAGRRETLEPANPASHTDHQVAPGSGVLAELRETGRSVLDGGQVWLWPTKSTWLAELAALGGQLPRATRPGPACAVRRSNGRLPGAA